MIEIESGLFPQLLNPVTEEDALPLIDAGWMVQQKFDGKRLMVRKLGGAIDAINKLGLVVTVPDAVREIAAQIPHDFVIDGEWVSQGSAYHAYDVLSIDGQDLTGWGYAERYQSLSALGVFAVAPVVTGKANVMAFAEHMQAIGAEGYVLKRHDAPYVSGRPMDGGDQLKVKFWNTASVVVLSLHPTKRSVEMGLDGCCIGNVTIPANHSVPAVGSVIEVDYLYCVKALVQPQYMAVRDDIRPGECTFRQQRIKFKGKAKP